MAKNPGAILAVIIPIAFIFIVFIIAVGECDSGDSPAGTTSQYETISRPDAVRRLAEMSGRVGAQDRFVSSGEMVVSTGKANLADTLPPVDSLDRHFPLNVNPRTTSQDVVIEIFCSTEKSGTAEPDDWFTTVATEFNNRGITTSSGKRVQIKVRYIASGTAYMYMASKKYMPDAFSPSNHLWIKMTEASGVPVFPVMERMVGNIAGIVMKDETYNKLKTNFGEVNLKAVIDAVAQGDIAMGYTDPYASSTGLNFLITILQTYAGGNEAKMLSPEVMSAFEAFSKNIPYVAFTTIQMRDSVQKGGMLDAFVLEYQTYVRERSLQSGYKFIPFGLRHDNPLYGVGALSPEKREALKLIAQYTESRKNLADKYSFNLMNEYAAPYSLPSGKTLIEAQLLWKEKKNAGRKIAAVFVSDVSGSMSGFALKNLKIALTEGAKFIDPANAIGLIEYNDTVRRTLPVSDFNALQQSRFLAAVKQMSAGGDTAMYDGIIAGLQMLEEFTSRNPEYRGVLFVLTDGETNAGKYQSIMDIGASAAALDVPIYTIAYGEKTNSSLLGQIASINEAATMSAKDEAIVSKIGALLNLEM